MPQWRKIRSLNRNLYGARASRKTQPRRWNPLRKANAKRRVFRFRRNVDRFYEMKEYSREVEQQHDEQNVTPEELLRMLYYNEAFKKPKQSRLARVDLFFEEEASMDAKDRL